MPNADGSETQGEMLDRMIRECAAWRERAMRLEMTLAERDAIFTVAVRTLRRFDEPHACQDADTLMGLLARTVD